MRWLRLRRTNSPGHDVFDLGRETPAATGELARLLDHLIGVREQRRRHGGAERALATLVGDQLLRSHRARMRLNACRRTISVAQSFSPRATTGFLCSEVP